MADFNLDEDVSHALEPELKHLAHDVMTTRYLRSKGTNDEARLSVAARMGRVLVTHNSTDYERLHRAWRRWSNEWDVRPRPSHAGIIVIPQSPALPTPQAAREIDALVRNEPDLSNQVFSFQLLRGWERVG